MQSVQVASDFKSTLSDILLHLEEHNRLDLELGHLPRIDKITHIRLIILGHGIEHAHIPTHESF